MDGSSLSYSSKYLNGSSSSLAVSWNSATATGGSPISGYLLRINSGYSTDYLPPLTVGASVTAHNFTALLEGATYRIQIAAINEVFTSNQLNDSAITYSSPALSVILADVPGAVSLLSQDLDQLGEGTISLKWTPPSVSPNAPIQSYTVYKDGGAGIYFPVATVLSAWYTESGLSHGNAINYKVAARNSAGEGLLGSEVTAYAGDKPCKIDSVKVSLQSQASLAI